MFLTKREHKKLRRVNRREAWKEKQDKIRSGSIFISTIPILTTIILTFIILTSIILTSIQRCRRLPNFGRSPEFGSLQKIAQKIAQNFCAIFKIGQKRPKKLPNATKT